MFSQVIFSPCVRRADWIAWRISVMFSDSRRFHTMFRAGAPSQGYVFPWSHASGAWGMYTSWRAAGLCVCRADPSPAPSTLSSHFLHTEKCMCWQVRGAETCEPIAFCWGIMLCSKCLIALFWQQLASKHYVWPIRGELYLLRLHSWEGFDNVVQ